MKTLEKEIKAFFLKKENLIWGIKEVLARKYISKRSIVDFIYECLKFED